MELPLIVNDDEDRKPGPDECQRDFYVTILRRLQRDGRLPATYLPDGAGMSWLKQKNHTLLTTRPEI